MLHLAVAVPAAVALVIAATGPAHAYLDPGTGTFILQILAAALVGGLFYIRRVGQAIKGFFIKPDSKPGSSPSE